jgi:hypothetical protein
MDHASDPALEAGFVFMPAIAAQADVDDAEDRDLAQWARIASGPQLDAND